jgi:hypothetical protein
MILSPFLNPSRQGREIKKDYDTASFEENKNWIPTFVGMTYRGRNQIYIITVKDGEILNYAKKNDCIRNPC